MGRIPARSDSGPDRRVRRLPALLGTPRGTHQIRGRALAVTVRIHQRLEDEWQRQWRPAMTSPEALAVEKFLHRFSRRSLDPIPTDGLLAAKQRIDTVIDERTRRFSLFDAPPELQLVPAPSPLTQHPSQASHPAAPVSQVAEAPSGPDAHHPTPITGVASRGACEPGSRRAVPLPGADLHGLLRPLVVQVRPRPEIGRA